MQSARVVNVGSSMEEEELVGMVEEMHVSGKKKFVCAFSTPCCKKCCEATHKFPSEVRAKVNRVLCENRALLEDGYLGLKQKGVYCLHGVTCYEVDCKYNHLYTREKLKVIQRLIRKIVQDEQASRGILTSTQRNSVLCKQPIEELDWEKRAKVEHLNEKHQLKKEKRMARLAVENPEQYASIMKARENYAKFEAWKNSGETDFSRQDKKLWEDVSGDV